MVIGSWLTSPFGRFADVMVETADGERLLLAPSGEIADFVSATYSFDHISIGPVTATQTAGSAGHRRREFYGVRRTHRIIEVTGVFRGADLAGIADLHPPVRFGFSSAPATPQLVSVTTTIDLPN